MPYTPFHTHIPYLSNLKVNASIQHQVEFPPILEVKWQKVRRARYRDIYIVLVEDIDINRGKFKGSTVDRSNPILLINGVTFEKGYDIYYRCLASNAEGWGASKNRTLSVVGSMFAI